MIKNYLKVAWRNILRSKWYSAINIGGLALGMAVTLIIGLWIQDELNYNKYFNNYENIAQVFQSQTFNGTTSTGPAIPRPLERALRDGYSDKFEHIIMSSWQNSEYLKYKDISLAREGNFMQREAPEMLSLDIVSGEMDGLREVNSIMLSLSTANALFGSEDPVGKALKVNNEFDMMVTGVYKDLPFNTHFHEMSYIMPWSHYITSQEWLKEAETSWGNNSFQLYVQLAENTNMDEVSATIQNVKKDLNQNTKEFNPQLFLLPMKDWHLRANFTNGKQSGGRIEYVWLFGFIGLFVLLLACINFMNLSTARSEKRSKEVGIRKSIGSQRNQLINQFLGESFLVVLMAYVLSLILVLLVLSGFNELSEKNIRFPWGSLTFWLSSLLFIAVTSIVAGSYPALYLSSFKPVDVLKGNFKAGKFAGLPRKVLVVIQFTVSVAFIIGTLIVTQQIQFAKNRPIGYDKEGLLQIPTMSQDFLGKYDLMRSEFLNSNAVVEMSSSSSPTTNVWSNRNGYTWEGKPEGFQDDFAWTDVSPEYAKSLNLKIVAGRDFSRDFSTDSMAVLINEAAAKYMGLANPVGVLLKDTDEENPDPPLTIIGVVEDMVMQSPYEPVKQGIFAYDSFEESAYYNLRLNPGNSASENLSIIENVFMKHFPDLPFQYQFVDQQYERKFRSEVRIGKLASIFTALAILISCLGLFGLTSFVAEQRTKEIGVRKVLGASVFTVWKMLSKDFIALVVFSCIIAIPISYYVMNAWLDGYTYRVSLSWWIFAAAIIGAIIITLLTVSFQALKAAKANPVNSLRTE